MHNRRTFIGSSLLAMAGSFVAKGASVQSKQFVDSTPLKGFIRSDNVVLPPSLKKGSNIAITAPASGIRRNELDEGISFLKSQGMNVILGKCLLPSCKYLSAPDNQRADEFNEFVKRDDIDAIICARGGYGVARILPLIDYGMIRSMPKVIVGYSDITALLIAILAKSGVVSYHGPVCSSTFDSTTRSSFMQVMMSNKVNAAEENEIANLLYESESLEVLHGGIAEAKLVGGNLSTICSTLGTPYEIDTLNSILFLEEIAEEPYKVDRMLTQLWLSGKFEGVKAVALGVFKSCESRHGVSKKSDGYSSDTMSKSLKQVFEQRFATMKVPVLSGLPFGHIKSKLTLPLGVRARIDCDAKSFRLLEPSVA